MSLNTNTSAKLQIIRQEGFKIEEQALGCFIMVNQELVDVITPLKQNNAISSEIPTTQIPAKGDLKLIVKKMNKESIYLGSLSICIESLPIKGFLWLDLNKDIENDSVNLTKEPTSNTKLLISIEKPPSSISSSSLYQLQLKKFEFLVTQLEEKLIETNTLYEQEKNARASLMISYEKLQKQHDDLFQKASQKEANFISLLDKKEKEIQDTLSKFRDLRTRYDTLKLEKNHLLDQVDFLRKSASLEVVENFTTEIEELKKIVSKLRNKEKRKNEEVEKIGKEWVEALRTLGLNGRNCSELENVEKIEQFKLKAQILEMNEKNLALAEKMKQLESEKNRLNLTIIEYETRKNVKTLAKDKENKQEEILKRQHN